MLVYSAGEPKVKNEWNYKSTPPTHHPICLRGIEKETLYSDTSAKEWPC